MPLLKRYHAIDIFALMLICFGLFSLSIFDRPFAVPDEARYVEIPREMVATNDYITPRLNGVKYFEKPPLYYWMQAAAFKVFGLKEWGMRLWGVILATLTVLGTYLFGCRFYNRATGMMAGLILSSGILFVVMAQLITLDMPVSCFVTLSLLSFFAFLEEKNLKKRRFLIYLFSVFSALGVLTKGIMALAIPGPAIVLYLTLSRRWHQVRPLYLPSALLLFLIIAVPWHVLAALKNPSFLHKYFIVEHIQRYLTDVHSRTKPVWFFIPIFLIGFLPWTTALVPALKRVFKDTYYKPTSIFLMIWAVFTLVFFSIGNSKLIPYIVPMLPAVSILCAFGLYHLWCEVRKKSVSLNIAVSFGFFAIVSFSTPLAFPELKNGKAYLMPYIYFLTSLFSLMCVFNLWTAKKSFGHRKSILSLFACALCISIGVGKASLLMQKVSLKPVIEKILPQVEEGDHLVSYKKYYQDLPLYSQRRVLVVDDFNELRFGTEVEDTSDWMMNSAQFLERAKKERMWIFGTKENIQDLIKNNPHLNLTIIDQTKRDLIAVNFDAKPFESLDK